MPGQQDVQKALGDAKIPDALKADAWDAYFQSKDPKEFQTRFNSLKGVPDDLKASLYDLKFAGGVDPSKKNDFVGAAASRARGIESEPGMLHKAAHELPTIGGMIGGMAGTAYPEFTGGPVRGAMAGGAIGQRALHYIDALSGRKPLPKLGEALEDVGVAAATQGAAEVGGQVVGKTLSGPLKKLAGPEQRATLATSEKYGLGLSSAEVMTGAGRTGRIMGRLQHGAMRAGMSDPSPYRKAGEENARKFLETSLDAFSGRTGSVTTGELTKEGLKAGKKGSDATTRAELAKVIAKSPPVDLTALKTEAHRILKEEILPTLKAFPAMSGNKAGKVAAGGVEMTADQLARMPAKAAIEIEAMMREQFTHAITQNPNTPVGKILKEILTADDEVPFDVAVRYRERLMKAGKAPDELLGNRATGTATHLANNMRETMATTAPDWAVASKAYGEDARLFQRKFIKDVAAKDPEFLMNSLTTKTGRTTPSRVKALREILLEKSKMPAPAPAKRISAPPGQLASDVSPTGQRVFKDMEKAGAFKGERTVREIGGLEQEGPGGLSSVKPTQTAPGKTGPAPEAVKAWNNVRRMWFDRDVLRDTSGQVDIAGLAKRLDRVDPDTMKEFFGDSPTFTANALELGAALKKRIAEPNSRLYEILEFSKMGAALAGGVYGGVTGGGARGVEVALSTAAGLEGVPALVTWALFNPKMTKYLITGLTEKDPSLAASALFRVVGEFGKDHRLPDERTPGSLPPVPGSRPQ